VAAHVGKPIDPTHWAGRSRTGIMKELEDEIGLAHRAAEAIRRK
jgi:hypothetical protein